MVRREAMAAIIVSGSSIELMCKLLARGFIKSIANKGLIFHFAGQELSYCVSHDYRVRSFGNTCREAPVTRTCLVLDD
jgi:hypothetical protein